MCLFYPKIFHNSAFYDVVETSCLGKMWFFFSYVLKCSQPIRLQFSLITNISGRKSVDIIDFLRGNNHQGEVGDETSAFGWVWPVVPLFQSNQIVGFYDHQYLWKESSEILVFCM